MYECTRFSKFSVCFLFLHVSWTGSVKSNLLRCNESHQTEDRRDVIRWIDEVLCFQLSSQASRHHTILHSTRFNQFIEAHETLLLRLMSTQWGMSQAKMNFDSTAAYSSSTMTLDNVMSAPSNPSITYRTTTDASTVCSWLSNGP